jgi:NAD(P)-dependent dehydrogenase (short-subunit alcohol dehydrogenase family)
MTEATRDRRSRHALVTGTSSGIGAAIAERLLAQGWRVTGFDRSAPSLGGPRFSPVEIDLLDEDQVRQRLAELGGVDALVHSAGLMRVAPLGEMIPKDGEIMWRLHVQVAALLCNGLAPSLPAGGRIVLIGSRVAAGVAGRSQYAATKAALVAMARSWAIELAPRGVTVNVVAPGATDTPFLRDPVRGSVPPRLPPIGRFVTPQEVAALTAYLLSCEADAITGQQIVICGGASL